MSLVVPHYTDVARSTTDTRRFLADWELAHMRALVASQANRLRKAEEELARARADAAAAWADADFWQTQAQTLIDELRDVEEGMSIVDELAPMPMAGVAIDAVHAQHLGKNDCATPGSADAYTTQAVQTPVGKI